MPKYIEDPSPSYLPKRGLRQRVEDTFNKAMTATGFGLPKIPKVGTPVMTKPFRSFPRSDDDMFNVDRKKRAKVVTAAIRG